VVCLSRRWVSTHVSWSSVRPRARSCPCRSARRTDGWWDGVPVSTDPLGCRDSPSG
jgi:hypothetical protein